MSTYVFVVVETVLVIFAETVLVMVRLGVVRFVETVQVMVCALL